MPFEQPEKVEKIESLSDNTMTCSNKIRHSSAINVRLFLLLKEKMDLHATEEKSTLMLVYVQREF